MSWLDGVTGGLSGRKPAPVTSGNWQRDSVDRRMQRFQRHFASFAQLLALFALAYAFSISWGPSTFWPQLTRVLAVCLVTIAAAASAGGLMGFLFGIPRLLQRVDAGHVADNAQNENRAPSFTDLRGGSRRAVAGNSNLEEVSDWLTKIIVGLTLVHLEQIRTTLWSVSAKASATAAVSESTQQAQTGFFLCLIIAAFVLGFLAVYLEARTRLAALISDTEGLLNGHGIDEYLIARVLQTPVLADSTGNVGKTMQAAALTPEDRKLLNIDYDELQTADEYAAWGLAHARAGKLLAAARALTDAIAKAPDKVEFTGWLADVRRLQRNPQAEVDILEETIGQGPADEQTLRRLMLMALYLPAPDGFERALRTYAQLAPAIANDPQFLLYYACALGQNAKWLKDNPASTSKSGDTFATLRRKALSAISKIADQRPDPGDSIRVFLRQLFDPTTFEGPRDENDLEVFNTKDPDGKPDKDAAEFLAALLRSRQSPPG